MFAFFFSYFVTGTLPSGHVHWNLTIFTFRDYLAFHGF